jgi:ABC-2 type transport system ATP-binding protein
VPDVEITGLVKRYHHAGRRGRDQPPVVAVDGVSLDIEHGEIFALLGPNGAGKTTLIGCVAGLVNPSEGSARVLGRDVVREYRLTRRAVGLVPQEINYDPFFNVEETLRFQAGYFGVRLDEARLVELLAALGLIEKRRANTRSLSGGMKRRLLIAKALVHQPKVLFLDEPTAGVDVELRRDLWGYVRELRRRGTTIVLTTHYLEEAEELADRVGLIDHGRILLVESKHELLRRFGQRTLRVTLTQPAAALPPPLVARGARRLDDACLLEITLPAADELGPVLSEIGAAGLHVRDVETRRTGLEEIYVKVLRADREHAA